jgi:hypothetical protein
VRRRLDIPTPLALVMINMNGPSDFRFPPLFTHNLGHFRHPIQHIFIQLDPMSSKRRQAHDGAPSRDGRSLTTYSASRNSDSHSVGLPGGTSSARPEFRTPQRTSASVPRAIRSSQDQEEERRARLRTYVLRMLSSREAEKRVDPETKEMLDLFNERERFDSFDMTL